MLLLRDKEVIKLKEGVGFKPKLSDITDNPRKLKFIEIDAAQSPRALDDVDAAAINTTPPRQDWIPSRIRSFAKIQRDRTSI